MEWLFNPDNPVFSFINKLIDGFVLSLLWVLCSIPIITMGAASSALYYAMVKSVRRERGHAVKEFFAAFKKNFKKGLVINLVLLLLGTVAFATDVPLMIMLLNTGKVADTVALIVFLLKAVILLGISAWIFPLISRFEIKMLELAKNALLLMLRYLHITVMMFAILFAALAAVYLEPLSLAFVPGLAAFLISLLLEPVLRSLVDPEDIDENEDTWFLEK